MRRDALLQYRAERLLRKDFHGLKPGVLAAVGARLRATGAGIDPVDLDACYSAAWHALYAALADGVQIGDPAAWLTLVTFRRAIDEWRASTRQRALGEAHASVLAAGHAGDIAEELDDRDRLRQLMEGFVVRMSPRERRAATLCYLHGLPRVQAARCMGVSEARMRKLMDGTDRRPGVAAKVGELLRSVGASEWCEQQSSLMRAHALGILDADGERQALAREHLRHCPGCRALVLALRGLAAALPPMVLPSDLSASSSARGGRLAGGRASMRAHALARAPQVGGSLMSKAALAGAVAVLGASGGYALLAHGAPGHARTAGHRRRGFATGSSSPPSAGLSSAPPRMKEPQRSPVSRRHAPARQRAHPQSRGQRVAPAPKRAAAGRSPGVASSSVAGPAQHVGPSEPAKPASGPSEEFTPEQVNGGR
jgi:DNA-directed RNA polymerase specialized sigma24 family protein